MRSTTSCWPLALFLLTGPIAHARAETGDWIDIKALLDLQAHYRDDDLASWYRAGPVGLRYGEGDSSVQLGQAGIEASVHTADTAKLEATAIYYGGGSDQFTLTEAFWQWRPVPAGNGRHQLKLGMFYAPISEEHTGPLWSSPYSVEGSVINSWLADEVRTLGAEYRWHWQDLTRKNPWQLSLLGAVYGGNDTAGTMLSWRGWAASDRQSGLGSEYKMSDFPSLDFPFGRQRRYFDPFVETDNRAGFYAGGDIGYRRNLKLSYLYYDNRAEPDSFNHGQYGWDTRFHHLGGHWQLSPSWELLGQYLEGDTGMGPHKRGVYNDYWASYLMLSHSFGRQRISLRWDRFEVIDRDHNPFDNNREHGRAATLSYSVKFGRGFKLSASYNHWLSQRPVRAQTLDTDGLPLPINIDSNQWLLSLRYYFDSRRE